MLPSVVPKYIVSPESPRDRTWPLTACRQLSEPSRRLKAMTSPADVPRPRNPPRLEVDSQPSCGVGVFSVASVPASATDQDKPVNGSFPPCQLERPGAILLSEAASHSALSPVGDLTRRRRPRHGVADRSTRQRAYIEVRPICGHRRSDGSAECFLPHHLARAPVQRVNVPVATAGDDAPVDYCGASASDECRCLTVPQR